MVDTPAGILAGKAAGCRVLAFRTTMSDDVLKSAGPDWIVDSCARITFQGTSGADLTLIIHDTTAVAATRA